MELGFHVLSSISTVVPPPSPNLLPGSSVTALLKDKQHEFTPGTPGNLDGR